MSLTYSCNFFNFATLAIFVLLIIFYLWAKYKKTYWSRRGVYSPPAHWFFGHFRDVFLLRASPQQVLGEIHRNCEDKAVVGIYVLQKPFLLIRDNEVIKHIFIKDAHVFPSRHFERKHKKSPQWQYLRTKMSPVFTPCKQKKLFEVILESAYNMKEHLHSRVSKDEETTINIARVSTKYTTDIISSLTFGIRTNSFAQSEFYMRSQECFVKSIGRSLRTLANFFFPKLHDFKAIRKLGRTSDYFRKIFWESMNEHEKSSTKRGDIIDELVEIKNDKENEQFSAAINSYYLLSQSVMLFVAGMESSAITITLTLMELARHPDMQEKVRDELREKLANEKLSYESIFEMNYLQRVVNETLRVQPTSSSIDRIAEEDYKIPGTDIVIQKGTQVIVNLTALHNDPRYHPNPAKFDPDRFSEERKRLIKPCTYMPFSEGPRNCIGQRTAILQIIAGLITILQEYEVSWDPKYKNELSNRLTNSVSADEIYLNFRRSPINI